MTVFFVSPCIFKSHHMLLVKHICD